MLVLSHPTGNANARAAALGLLQAGQLTAFQTSIATFPGDWLDRLSGLPGLGELRRRRFDPALKDVTAMWPWREAGRLLASRAGLRSLTAHERGAFCVDAVYRSLDLHIAHGLAKAGTAAAGRSGVYAYEDGALASFQAARSLGIARLYDLPIGYWRAARRLLDAEQARWPEWQSTLTGFLDSEEKLARKDQELRLADRIFVASSFTRRTLADFPGPLAAIEVIPYGFPAVGDARQHAALAGRPLKLLFVGGLSQRKGIADLFAAVRALGSRVELTVVGAKAVEGNAALDAALAAHRWIPSLPHDAILKLMREHDVFVFPSLFEGFGLVITEAMSQGTPVITTDRTAGPDLIEHGRNGWLVEAGNTAALQASIENLLQHPEQVAAAGREAMDTARRRPWEVYGRELAEAVARTLDDTARRPLTQESGHHA